MIKRVNRTSMCFHFMGHRVSRPLASMWLVDLFLSVPKALTVQGRGGRSGNHAVVGAIVGDEQPGRRIVSQGTEKKILPFGHVH